MQRAIPILQVIIIKINNLHIPIDTSNKYMLELPNSLYVSRIDTKEYIIHTIKNEHATLLDKLIFIAKAAQ